MKHVRSRLGVTPVEFLGPGTKAFDSWDSEYRGIGETHLYGSKRNIQLLFGHLGIKSGTVADICCGERTVIPDIPTLRGFAVEVDSDFFERAVDRYHREKKAGTPVVEFRWADVSSETLAPAGSCKAVIWNGDVSYYLKKCAMDLKSGVRLKEQLKDEGRAKEQLVDHAMVNSYNLLESGGVLIATGENPIEVYDRAKRLGLPVAKLTVVGEPKPPGPPRAVAVVLHKP